MTALHGSANYRRALQHGERYSDHVLALRALRRAEDETADGVRVGVTVGKRFGGAVQRNRFRRWLRASVRAALRSPRGAWDLVFIPRSGARTVTHDQLRASVSRLVGRAGVSGHGE